MTGIASSSTWIVLLFISNWSSWSSYLGVAIAFRPTFSSKAMRIERSTVEATVETVAKKRGGTKARKHRMLLLSRDSDKSEGEPSSEKAPVTNIWKKAVEAEENLVRSLTGKDSYEFGQFTKNITQAAVTKTEETIRSVTDNDTYQFGDFAKASAENLLLENDAGAYSADRKHPCLCIHPCLSMISG
mmetsp:Transcript_22668/g.25307  ORF Transcript_22668/g.25307 Transcript_22668/m.25307 type:complete len:187 (-) Transcript_22668:821-1381(-)